MVPRLTLLFAAVLIVGCERARPPDPPGYAIVIPDDIPEHLILTDMDGTKHDGNGREMYAAFHRAGWRQCWEEYQRGRLDPRDKRAADDRTPQCYGIEARGFVDGFKGCQRYILQKQ